MSRPCIIICNFNDKEAKLLKTYGSMMGLKDQIRVNWTNGNTLVKDILEDNKAERQGREAKHIDE